MLRFYLAYQGERVRFRHDGGPIEFGRAPHRAGPQVIADPLVSNDQLRVEARPGGRVRLENLSRKVPLLLGDGTTVVPGGIGEYGLPVRLTVGATLIEIDGERAGAVEDVDVSALRSVAPPPHGTASPPSFARVGEAPDAQELMGVLETVVAVQRSSAHSPDFYRETAQAVVKLVGLDYGLVLLRRGDDWEVVAREGPGPSGGPEFSRTTLRVVAEERRTFFQATAGDAGRASLLGFAAVAAAPILGGDGRQVVGAVYGARRGATGPGSAGPGEAIRPLQAQLLQVLASAVAVGLARSESEARAARKRVQFEQFFSEELARELDRDPSLLEGRERPVTILFADLRGFSRTSERLGPAATCTLIGEVMQQLTRCVRDQGGVVVDYLGDGLLAMWNAPADQPDHAPRACRAALAMRAELPGLNDRWRGRLLGPLDLGVGVNTGPALVGNTGSLYKFKYGPMGHAVNLASRVEGATKQLGVPVLITGATAAGLDGSFDTRRLGRARVVGIAEPVELFELHAEGAGPEWRADRDTYEAGLAHFEAGRWAEAGRTLYALLAGEDASHDLPTLTLVGRSVECLKDPSRPFDPVLELTSK